MICVLVYFDSFVVSTVFTWKKKTTIAMVSVNVCVCECVAVAYWENLNLISIIWINLPVIKCTQCIDMRYITWRILWSFSHFLGFSCSSLPFSRSSIFSLLFSSFSLFLSPLFQHSSLTFSSFSVAPSHLSVILPFSEFLPCSLASSEFCPLFLYFPLIPCFQNWLPPGGH